MAQANPTNKVSLLRRLYGDDFADHMWSADPLLSDIKKDTSGFGEGRYVVVRTGQITGVSPDFTTALNNKNPAAETRFFVDAKLLYATFGLDGLYIRKARGKPNSLVKGYDAEARSAMYKIKTELAAFAWGNVGGAIGQIASTVTLGSTTLVLRNAQALFGRDLTGMSIQLSSDNGTGASPAGVRSGSLTVTAVNWDTNTITTNANISTISGATVNDFVFPAGYYNASMTGMQGWVPVTPPSPSENFFGIDRSTSPNLLSGWRVPSAGLRETTLIDAMVKVAQVGGDTPKCYANFADWGVLAKEVGAKYIREASDGKQGVGAKGIEVYGPRGTCTVVGSNLVPQGNAWVGDPSSMTLLSEGECPDILDEDKVGPLLRSATADTYDSRLGCYANFLPNDSKGQLGPGGWVVVTW